MSHVAFDFVNSAGTAQWVSQAPGVERLAVPFPGSKEEFRQGFALVWPVPTLEDGNRPPLALGLHPRTVEGAELIGRYPPFILQAGDFFETIIGYVKDSNPKALCRWEVGYFDMGNYFVLGIADKTADGRPTVMRFDLSPYVSGRPVEFNLKVTRLNNEKDFEPVLVTPRIERV